MGNLVREIRKEVNFSVKEYQEIQNLMIQDGYEQFSPFARGKLLEPNCQSSPQLEDWIKYWQHQKVEQIYQDVHEILVLAKSSQSVTLEHLEIILTCVKDLMNEIENTIPLSYSFKDKYMR
ncbi:SAG1252 family conjugative relaxosome accessory protein [Streptococcus oralis]|uniref:SAG1252 family conjugative relaxosome accessory protein n=1 Tax=Streptococcus oralis TaxID=1303 RepID=UPI0039C07D68